MALPSQEEALRTDACVLKSDSQSSDKAGTLREITDKVEMRDLRSRVYHCDESIHKDQRHQ